MKYIIAFIIPLAITLQVYAQSPRTEPADALEEKLAARPLDKPLREQARQVNYDLAKQFRQAGKKELQRGDWYDGYYFNNAIKYFANALKYGHDQQDIDSLVRATNKEAADFARQNQEFYRVYQDTTLYKMTSSYQARNMHRIDSMKEAINALDTATVDKKVLLGYYTKLISAQNDYYERGKFQGYSNQYRKERARLRVKLGDVDGGCEEYYKIDIVNFSYFPIRACDAWYKKYAAQQQRAYEAEEKTKAKAWYATNPKSIKLLSLLGEGSTTVEAYLGLAIASNYKINSGAGANVNQYIGKKYKNKHGVYEIGYRNDNVTFIKFTPPAGTIVYDPEKNENAFDFDLGSRSCIGTSNDGFIGSVKTHTVEYDCTDSPLRVVFYGVNGKLSSVQVH